MINVNDEQDFKGIPGEIELYYPLSPKLAMWFVLASKSPTELSVDLSEAEVRSYNACIVENHHEQLYASTENALTEWISSQKE